MRCDSIFKFMYEVVILVSIPAGFSDALRLNYIFIIQ